MNKKKHKILLTALKNASSEDVDLFLEIDLVQSYKNMNQSRYDNNFDLAEQFVKERNASRNFRIYGEISSTIIDCNNLTIRVFTDPLYLNEIDSVETTLVSYGKENVFGKKRGKYILEVDSFFSDDVYFQVDSDNFSYKQQRWSQKLVHYDTEGNFAPYGTETLDINLDSSVLIENNFPFFFNKHWIRLDYDIIEEKVAKYTWDAPETTLSEGQSVNHTLSLDKLSPFGNERLTLTWSPNTPFAGYSQGVLSGLGADNPQRVFEVNIPPEQEDQSLAALNGNAFVLIPILPDNLQYFTVGQNLRILDGDYQGAYTIEAVSTLGFFGDNEEFDFTAIVLSAQFFDIPDNTNSSRYFVGTAPDISIFHEGNQVSLPLDLEWTTIEQNKLFTFQANTDFEIELDEFFKIDGENAVRVEKGVFPYHGLTLLDNTVQKEVRYNFGNIWENRARFTGRTSYDITADEDFDRTAPGPSILRNGNFWQGRNEEFYTNDFFDLTITNEGIRTIIPPNELLGTDASSTIEAQESRTFRIKTPYSDNLLHKVEIIYEDVLINSLDDLPISAVGNININGTDIAATSLGSFQYIYENMKSRLDDGPSDWYRLYGTPKPFKAVFDDDARKITLTSTSPGVRLVVFSKNPITLVNYLNTFQLNPQMPMRVSLYANSNQNQESRYKFTINKLGYKETYIPSAPIQATEGAVVDRYLVTGYRDILYPYDSTLEQCNFRLNANDLKGVSYYEATFSPDQNQIMEYGSVIINGVLLLSSSLLPLNEENLTQQGFFLNENDEIEFMGEFRAAPIVPIPCTSEIISTQNTRAIWEVQIEDMSDIGNNFNGTRSFDITLGNGDGAYTLTVGGPSSSATKRAANTWWNGFPIPVSDENGPLEPNAILRLRLDEGNGNEVPEGPFSGSVTNNKLTLVSKTPGLNVQLDNLVNFDGYNEGENANLIETLGDFLSDIFEEVLDLETEEEPDINPFSLKAKQFAPGIEVGELNTGRNGLGGFRFNIE